MESTCLCSTAAPFRPFSKSGGSHGCGKKGGSSSTVRVFASGRSEHRDNGGRLVDENLIVLRKRIHEMKMVERNYEPPSDWMEWEKHFYTSYDAFICNAMGLLQSQLMNTRPCLVLGMMALITLSVPTSAFVIFCHFLEIAKGIMAGIRLGT